ncbi:hypothetical protein [Flavivirga eckloniae]|uniref:Uncharacterized protein n=1 Tax=Flavivirga eckloniae TaxID=1803846 RepID=A0A2K9PJH5_9FLAO|nr:hypothetical protein [Flavivirga eckloniae]AUP77211.1 hypothetical protein C1H87_00145 [Flavivirga eckloniae]
MKKLAVLMFLSIITLISCDGRDRKYKTNTEVLKENKLLKSFKEAIKFVPETYTEIKSDTILSNGFKIKINYYSVENDFVLETKKSKNDSLIKIHHKNFEAQLLVFKNNTIINQSLINKKLFYNDDITFWQNAIMQFVWIDHEASNKNELYLNTSFCIPSTEECKDFVLKINKQGIIKIEEVIILSNTV